MAQIESLTADAIIALINAGTWPQVFPPVLGSTVLLNDQVAADVKLASNVVVGLKNIGSAASAAGVIAFEASVNSTNGTDGDWVSIQAVRTDSNTIENGRAASSLAAGAVQGYGWELAVNGFTYFRVRVTTALTAGANFQWTIARGAYATEPVPAIQTHPVTISGTPAVTSTPAGGSAIGPLTSAATINALSIKSTAGNLNELSIFNGSAATVYVKFWNKTAIPVPSTDAAVLACIIPVTAGAVVNIEFGALGKRFTLGIAMAITAAVAATDATAVATGVVVSGTFN